jgi:hypothetical protein
VFLYEVGLGGVVPWHAVGDFDDKASERESSHKLDPRAWLGGHTTLPYGYSDESDNNFMQMATNMSSVNAQPFVRAARARICVHGRRARALLRAHRTAARRSRSARGGRRVDRDRAGGSQG